MIIWQRYLTAHDSESAGKAPALQRRSLQRRYLAGDTPAGKAAQENGRAV